MKRLRKRNEREPAEDIPPMHVDRLRAIKNQRLQNNALQI